MPASSGGAARDFFLSYNRADQAWAEWIARQLKAAGYSTVLQAWDFLPGSNFVLETTAWGANTRSGWRSRPSQVAVSVGVPVSWRPRLLVSLVYLVRCR